MSSCPEPTDPRAASHLKPTEEQMEFSLLLGRLLAERWQHRLDKSTRRSDQMFDQVCTVPNASGAEIGKN